MGQPETRVDWVIVTLPIIIIIFGLIGNVFSIAVLLRERFRRRSISIYLIALAIFDCIFLVNSHPVAWTGHILFDLQYQSISDTACALSNYVMMFSRTTSAWILVVLTAERMLAMSIPHLAAEFTSRKRAAISTAVVIVVLAATYSFSFFVFGIYPNGNCYYKREIEIAKVHILLSVFDFMIYMVVPSTIMATCNSVLLFLLWHSREIKQRTESENKNVVITIVCVTIAFIILTAPMCLNNMIYLSGMHMDTPDYLYTVFYSLDLLNHAINFLLYSVSGPTFRKEIKTMFTSKCCRSCCSNKDGYREGLSTGSTTVDLDSVRRKSLDSIDV